ncbi:hypothetical protein J3R30DRAFT_229222 [Lentinula aciculospora]|uniref:DUF6534 domain-containing protein n=1 Tax=Lentinula aciculospora TaxID=153920 RepID=A0A9W9A9E8_9AGAR|nr:hypothetical protein J3R30DRAFT_229222 [Lentinula aciculospora]
MSGNRTIMIFSYLKTFSHTRANRPSKYHLHRAYPYCRVSSLGLVRGFFHSAFHSERDSFVVKSFVYVTIVIQLSAIFFITHTIWGTLVLNFGVIAVVTHVPWSTPLALLTTGMSTSLAQMFFSWRIYTLSGGATKRGRFLIFFLCIAIIISTMQFSACVVFNVKFYLMNRNFELVPSLNKISEVWLASAVTGDWINGVTFVFMMRRERKNSAFPQTKIILDKIIINFVESGLITATLALADLIVFIILPSTTVRVTLEFALGPLYANVMMANLNSREKIRQAAHALEMNTFTSTSHGTQSRPGVQIIQNPGTFSTSIGHATDLGRVRLDTSVIHHSDDGDSNLDAKLASLT